MSAWKKASKKGERRQMIRWPKDAPASSASKSEADSKDEASTIAEDSVEG